MSENQFVNVIKIRPKVSESVIVDILSRTGFMCNGNLHQIAHLIRYKNRLYIGHYKQYKAQMRGDYRFVLGKREYTDLNTIIKRLVDWGLISTRYAVSKKVSGNIVTLKSNHSVKVISKVKS